MLRSKDQISLLMILVTILFSISMLFVLFMAYFKTAQNESKMAIIYQLSTNNTPCEEMVLFVKENI